MKSHELVAWASNLVDQVINGNGCEDGRVEFKSVWPDDPVKAARRIAGHANAGRGESVLWIIGVDEKAKRVCSLKHEDLANWWPRVHARFDGVYPELTSAQFSVNGVTVVALLFDSEQAPFVVTNPNGGAISHEVPWRDGTRVRSATRSELLRLLSPLQRAPEVEVRSGHLSYEDSVNQMDCRDWKLMLELYIIPKSQGRITIPYHHCEVWIQGPYRMGPFPLSSISMGDISAGAIGNTVWTTVTSRHPTHLALDEPDRIYLGATGRSHRVGGTVGLPARVTAKLLPIGAEKPVIVDTELVWTGNEWSKPQS